MAARSPLPSASLEKSQGTPRKGVRLTADTVFKLLKKTNKEWDWLAKFILQISSSKYDEIRQRCSNEDDCLMEAIRFWMKRCPFASYRWIACYFNLQSLRANSQEMHHLLEPIQDATLTSANLHSALASLSDDELRSVVVVSSQTGVSREQRITDYMMIDYSPTWEDVAGWCFYREQGKALEEVKKYFKRKLEPSLTATNLCSLLADMKDWSTKGMPRYLQIPSSKVEEMEQLYPDLFQRQSALIQYFLDVHPAPSWELVCNALYWSREYEVLENVQNKYFKGTSETRRQLKMAMKRGKGKTSITKCHVAALSILDGPSSMSDTFFVARRYCITRVTHNQTRLRNMANIKFKKTCWGLVKNSIERNAGDGIRNYYTHLDQVLKEHIESLPAKRKKAHRRASHHALRLKSKRCPSGAVQSQSSGVAGIQAAAGQGVGEDGSTGAAAVAMTGPAPAAAGLYTVVEN